ncbi:MAG: HD domain-containing phosphohydrolase [Pseudomonadota bacterium]
MRAIRQEHSRRVADLARKIAVQLELDARETQDIFLAGLLHNIGKIGFSDTLLSTPFAQLSGENLNEYRKHSFHTW